MRQSFAENGSDFFPWRFYRSTEQFNNPHFYEVLDLLNLAKKTHLRFARGVRVLRREASKYNSHNSRNSQAPFPILALASDIL